MTHQQLVIQGHPFTAPSPYTAGHPLSEIEASVLNTTFGENLRNNFAGKVRDAKEKYAKEKGIASAGEVELPPEVLNDLQASFSEYAGTYTFGARKTAAPKFSKVETEARKIARAKLYEALRKKNVDPKTVEDEVIEKYLSDILERYPEIRAEAQRRVSAIQDIALDLVQGEAAE